MTRAATATGPIARTGLPVRAVVAMVLAVSPTLVLAYLLANPPANLVIAVPVEHFVVTTNVSVVALLVGVLVARSALQLRHFPSLLLAIGFVCMAAIFAVHGLATPGVLLRGASEADALLVVGVSGQLALWVPAIFFAIRYTALAPLIERRAGARVVLWVVAIALVAYAAAGLFAPSWFGGLAGVILAGAGGTRGYGYGGAPTDLWGGAGFLPFLTSGTTVALLAFAAWRQGAEFVRTKLPLQGSLAFSYVLLAQAQVAQFLGPIWTLSWWEYHGLMLAAVAIAVGAIFVELDRRRGLERFLPPTVVERVVTGEMLRLGGERRTATILFADLRGSTALAERLAPEAAVAVLNAYLRLMARAVIERGGILDKFLGDGLMAIFGAMGDPREGADAAARCALDIRAAAATLNEERERDGAPVARFGVGIHTGEVVLGVVGLPERSDYTALGDTVNTASRMESLCKEFGVDVVLSGDTARLVRVAPARALGPAQVRGKAEPIEVFTLA